MNVLASRKYSLKNAFITGIGTILLALVLISAGSFWFIERTTSTFDYLVQHPLREINEVMDLEQLAVKTAISANRYLIRKKPIDQQRFRELSRQLDASFAEKSTMATLFPEQRALLHAASSEWEKARTVVGTHFNRAEPPQTPSTVVTIDIERVDAHIQQMLNRLHELHDLTVEEAVQAEQDAQTTERRVMLLFAGTLLMMLMIAWVSSLALGRGVFLPLRRLEKSVDLLAAGDLSHRVQLDMPTELGHLAERFNAMADQLEKSQTELKDLSIRDSLTGALNHREFQYRLSQELARARRYGEALTLLMIDIDHFKSVNDTHGHQVGDEVLRAVTSLIQGQLRHSEQLARYGGEEFTVILPKTDGRQSLTVAERIRRSIAEQGGITAEGRALNITVSIGVACYPQDADTEERLIAAADRALYVAKESGRNRVSGQGKS